MELVMIGFVDDSNGQMNCFMSNEDATTLPSILIQLPHTAHAWADILGTKGGALELTKCSCHVAVWTFAAKGDPVLIYTTTERCTFDCH